MKLWKNTQYGLIDLVILASAGLTPRTFVCSSKAMVWPGLEKTPGFHLAIDTILFTGVRKTMNRQNIHITTIVILTVLITYLQFATIWRFPPHVILKELYYVPLILGVLRFGLKGALATYLFVSAAFSLFFFGATTFPQLIDRVLHLMFSGLFVVVASLLVERERNKHVKAEQERYFAGIGQAATVIVHDLKNPLISILGFARRIQEAKGDSTLAARTITESALTMQRIVSDVLEFARPMRLDFTKNDVIQSIWRACESCRIKAEENDVDLSMDLPTKSLTCSIDNFQLERALVNLIDNSIDASFRGSKVIVNAADSKNKLTISIKDSGSGMDKETLDNLFTLTYTTKAEGTGFGVPISKKIIEAHGGSILIKSEKDVGTEVIIKLPVKKL